jgi:hypothetical protein
MDGIQHFEQRVPVKAFNCRKQIVLLFMMVAPVKNPPYRSHLALHPIQSPLYLI